MERTRLPLYLLTLILSLYPLHGALATVTPYLDPGFQFDYDKPAQPLSIPITSQCERIRLKWSRESNNTGKFPVAPYFLQVYSSASSTPYFIPAGFGPTFDWDVPFAPNTQYQICMYDINGVSGGCQQTYSVISNTTVDKPTCENVNPPPALSVTGSVPTGALPQFGYIDQCKTLSVTPKSGSPPYTLTVAPSGHPPFNITSNSMDTVSWTVSLPVGFRFFLSLSSADGQMWSNGPIRVGGQGPTSCLAPDTILKSTFDKIVIASSIGGTALGLILGIISYILFLRFRPRQKPPSQTYYSRPYFSRDESTRPLKTTAPSTIGTYMVAPSTLGALSSLADSPSLGGALLTTTPSALNIELPQLSPPPPLVPLRHSSQTSSRRSNQTHPSVEPYTVPPSEFGRAQSQYLADVKRPFTPNDTPLLSGEDSDPFAAGSVSRRVSVASRAPTYVPRTPPPPRRARGSHSRGAVVPSNETEDEPELPPLYGHHTTDPSLNYAPETSSGARF